MFATRRRASVAAAAAGLLCAMFTACGEEEGSTVGAGAGTQGSGAAGAAGGQGGAGGMQCPPSNDPCEVHATHAACCADPACGWHDGTGHQLFGIPPCVSSERICEVDGMKTRDCAPGTTCVSQGSKQCTADDCVAAPGGGVCLVGRGICACVP